ncbi:invasion associated locus B family protein [Methylobacterium thuringiense]|uniref:invasion associated locus B family protein n=1 Tax=Methylobacterium thuringiense TaxID=1003091 RepID=UPI001EDFC4D1|nr:invasion associated locus B family protein [Methylobacterium thuringiense]
MQQVGKSSFVQLACLALALLPVAAQGRPVAQGLTTAAVDRELFRDGEVKRRNERFANWSLDCDEIPRLGQRYCSLRALARDATGMGVADFTLSTDDRGKPAALIGLPFGVDLASPVTIEPALPLVLGQPSAGLAASTREIVKTGKKSAARGAVNTDILRFALRPAFCDSNGCHVALALKPADIAALRAGAGVRIRFAASGRDGRGFVAHGDLPIRSIEAVITSEGFGQALEASIR